MKIFKTIDFLEITEKENFLSKNDTFSLLPGTMPILIRPLAICNDGFSLSIQASSVHHSKKDENGIYQTVELGRLSSPEISLSEYEDGCDHKVYNFVPVTLVDAIIAKHGGIVMPD